MSTPEHARTELRSVPDYPLVDQVRASLQHVLAGTDVHAPVHEYVGDYPSPTLLINDRDVTGTPPEHSHANCRLDLPTENQILDALHQAQ